MKKLKIAIFPSSGLGDGIIQLVLAQNLSTLDLEVDYYHDFLSDINAIVDNVNVLRLSQLDFKQAQQFTCYDVVLADRGLRDAGIKKFDAGLENKLAVYSISKTKPKYKTDLRHLIPATERQRLGKKILSTLSGKRIRMSRFLGLSTAGHIAQFLKHSDLVTNTTDKVALNIPRDWLLNKYPKRIIIHPSSTSIEKNWLPEQYLELAQSLIRLEFHPVFSISPAEHQEWKLLTAGKFDLICFDNISTLAKYYYQSAALIGNDSGNGHLASVLGLPTITIVNLRKKNFTWRPNWGENHIVKPLISRKFVGSNYWKHTVSVRRVIKTFKLLNL